MRSGSAISKILLCALPVLAFGLLAGSAASAPAPQMEKLHSVASPDDDTFEIPFFGDQAYPEDCEPKHEARREAAGHKPAKERASRGKPRRKEKAAPAKERRGRFSLAENEVKNRDLSKIRGCWKEPAKRLNRERPGTDMITLIEGQYCFHGNRRATYTFTDVNTGRRCSAEGTAVITEGGDFLVDVPAFSCGSGLGRAHHILRCRGTGNDTMCSVQQPEVQYNRKWQATTLSR